MVGVLNHGAFCNMPNLTSVCLPTHLNYVFKPKNPIPVNDDPSVKTQRYFNKAFAGSNNITSFTFTQNPDKNPASYAPDSDADEDLTKMGFRYTPWYECLVAQSQKETPSPITIQWLSSDSGWDMKGIGSYQFHVLPSDLGSSHTDMRYTMSSNNMSKLTLIADYGISNGGYNVPADPGTLALHNTTLGSHAFENLTNMTKFVLTSDPDVSLTLQKDAIYYDSPSASTKLAEIDLSGCQGEVSFSEDGSKVFTNLSKYAAGVEDGTYLETFKMPPRLVNMHTMTASFVNQVVTEESTSDIDVGILFMYLGSDNTYIRVNNAGGALSLSAIGHIEGRTFVLNKHDTENLAASSKLKFAMIFREPRPSSLTMPSPGQGDEPDDSDMRSTSLTDDSRAISVEPDAEPVEKKTAEPVSEEGEKPAEDTGDLYLEGL